VFGFENDADATRALAVLRKAAARQRSVSKGMQRSR
jgi:hypothetical protein